MELVTLIRVGDPKSPKINVSRLLLIELDDGERVPVLTDGGWSSSGLWEDSDLKDLESTAIVVVGPDAPYDDFDEAHMAREYWEHLEHEAKLRNVDITAAQLSALPHHVEVSEDVVARVRSV